MRHSSHTPVYDTTCAHQCRQQLPAALCRCIPQPHPSMRHHCDTVHESSCLYKLHLFGSTQQSKRTRLPALLSTHEKYTLTDQATNTHTCKVACISAASSCLPACPPSLSTDSSVNKATLPAWSHAAAQPQQPACLPSATAHAPHAGAGQTWMQPAGVCACLCMPPATRAQR